MLRYLKALFIAVKAHKGQKDKGGRAYIWHPIRVSFGVKGVDAKTVALLHDVIEDTPYTIDDLAFLTDRQKEALLLLTHDKGEPYFDYVKRLSGNPIAREVKRSDLRQNMNLRRLKVATEKDFERVRKYQKAYNML